MEQELIISRYLFIFIETFKITWNWPNCASSPTLLGLVKLSRVCLPTAITSVLGNHEGMGTTLTINQRDKSFYCLCNNDAEICRALITL